MVGKIDDDLMSLDDEDETFQHILKYSVVKNYRLNIVTGKHYWNYVIEYDENDDYSLFIEDSKGRCKIERFIVLSSDKLDDVKVVSDSYELKDGEYYAEKHHIEKRYSTA